MWSHFIRQIETSPHLFWVVGAIGLHLLNATLGTAIVFGKNGLRRSHSWVYYGVLTCLFLYFIQNRAIRGNGFVEWLVLIYFVVAIPQSKRWDVLFHGFIAIVGLTFLPLLILLNFL